MLTALFIILLALTTAVIVPSSRKYIVDFLTVAAAALIGLAVMLGTLVYLLCWLIIPIVIVTVICVLVHFIHKGW